MHVWKCYEKVDQVVAKYMFFQCYPYQYYKGTLLQHVLDVVVKEGIEVKTPIEYEMNKYLKAKKEELEICINNLKQQ